MSAIGDYIRIYNYDRQPQGGISNYTKILNEIHFDLEKDMQRRVLKGEALRLQNYLQRLKAAIIYLSNSSSLNNIKQNSNSVIQQKVQEMVEDESIDTFFTIIENAMAARKATGSRKSSLNLLLQSHFIDPRKRKARKHLEGTSTVSEDDLHYIFQGLEATITGQISDTKYYVGTQQTHLLNNKSLSENLIKDTLSDIEDRGLGKFIQEEAKKANKTVHLTDFLHYEFSGKADLSGRKLLEIIGKYTIEDDWLQDFAQLMGDATFSLKGYIGTYYPGGQGEWKDPSLHLGKSFPLKPVVATLDKLGWSSVARNAPRDMFYRGAQIITGDVKNRNGHPTATSNEVIRHFNHMRFTYELSGYGLYSSEQENESTFVKYIIYNDPQSERIYVKDTASLILDVLRDKSSVGELYEAITLKASDIES